MKNKFKVVNTEEKNVYALVLKNRAETHEFYRSSATDEMGADLEALEKWVVEGRQENAVKVTLVEGKPTLVVGTRCIKTGRTNDLVRDLEAIQKMASR